VPAGGGAGGFTTALASGKPLPEPEIAGKVCTLKPGDVGYEECEACQ